MGRGRSTRATPGEEVASDGIVLRLTPYRDADLVVTLFTRALGKVGALARSARRSQRRFGGALQPFVHVDLELRLRPSAELAELDSASPRRDFPHLGDDPHRLGRAGYLCELVEALSRDRDPQPALLELLLDGLALLEHEDTQPTALLRGFEVALLHHLGLWPDADQCARCGGGLDHGMHESVDTDGWLCRSCGDRAVPPEEQDWLRPRPLQTSSCRPITVEVAREVGRRTLQRVRALTGRTLRSVAFLKQLES
ncbi:MAG: DNA repair protein RecO [Pseudomonadota bacterium]